jgi:hypothetical protein
MASELPQDQQQALNALTSLVTQELAKGRRPDQIIKQLTKQGVSEENASRVVYSVQQSINNFKASPQGRKIVADQSLQRMLRGGAICVLGIIVTVVTYGAATSGGGTYFVCWGAIIFGAIDFIIGLFGWLKNM